MSGEIVRGAVPYVDRVDYLTRVKTERYYKEKRKQSRADAGEFSFGVGPSAPYTRRGVKIVDKNFPEADMVCPYCEREFVETTTVRPLKE